MNLYIAINELDNFDALVMAKDKEDALRIIKDYAADADMAGKWNLKPTELSFAKKMSFSCDYLLQDPKFDTDGVIDVGDIEEYYQNFCQLSQAIKIRLNNDMTLLLLQEKDGVKSKVVMGQDDDIEYTNVVLKKVL